MVSLLSTVPFAKARGMACPKISGAEVYFARGKHGEQIIQFTMVDNMDSRLPQMFHILTRKKKIVS